MKEFDPIFDDYVGANGNWQWTVALILCVGISGTVMFPIFGSTLPMHRCRMENEIENYLSTKAYALQFNFTFEQISGLIEGVTISPTGCNRMSQTWTKDNFINLLYNNTVEDATSKTKEICHRGYVYNYNKNQYASSIVESWNLVCESAWLVPLTTSAYMLSMIPGMFLGSWLSDRFGRRPVLVASAFFELCFGVGASFVPSFVVFLVFRCCIGVLSATQIVVSTVLMVELTSAKYRGQFTSVWGVFVDCLHPLITAGLAYFICCWRWLHFFIFMFKVLCLAYPWLIPESPMWLISRGKCAKAIDVLKMGQKINSENCFRHCKDVENMQSLEELESVIGDINFENPEQSTSFSWINIRSFIAMLASCSFILMGVQATYFGIIFYATLIRSSIYVVVSINALSALPGPLISMLCYRYSPTRKSPLIIIFLLNSSLLFTVGLYTILVKPSHDWALVVGGNLGFMLLGASINMLYVYISELFPMHCRTKGLGFAIGLGRIGAVCTGFINQTDITLGHSYPMLIYASILLVVSSAYLCLPDIRIEGIVEEEDIL